MKTITLNIPESINEFVLKVQLGAILFNKGILSSGQAAELAGLSKREFLESLGQHGVSIFGESADDIDAILNE